VRWSDDREGSYELGFGVYFLQMLFVDQEAWLTRFMGIAWYTGVCGFAGCGYQKGD